MKDKKRLEISRFDNFSNKNEVRTKTFYNYLPSVQLQNTKGIELAKFPFSKTNPTEYSLSLDSYSATSIDGINYFQQYFNYSSTFAYKLFLYDNSKNIYVNYLIDDDDEINKINDLTFNTPPIMLPFKQNDTDSIILADDQKVLVWKTMNAPAEIENAPIITSMCSSGNVLYCTILDPAFKIWYTTDLNAEKIGDIGKNSNYVSLEDELGDAKKVLIYDRNVYVIREFGISKINFIKNEVTVSEVYKSNTRILHNTVGICGNLMWFMTKNNIFTFNGIKVSKFNINVSSILSGFNEFAVSATLGNEFYLALKLNYNDSNSVLCESNQNYVNNALIIIDTDNNSYQIIRGVDIKKLLPVKTPVFEKMLCIFNSDNKTKIGQICNKAKSFSSNLPKFWLSENLTDNDPKVITNITVNADVGVVFKIIYGNKEQSFTTYTSGYNSFRIKIYCNDFKLQITSNNESAKVEKVSIEYYVK